MESKPTKTRVAVLPSPEDTPEIADTFEQITGHPFPNDDFAHTIMFTSTEQGFAFSLDIETTMWLYLQLQEQSDTLLMLYATKKGDHSLTNAHTNWETMAKEAFRWESQGK